MVSHHISAEEIKPRNVWKAGGYVFALGFSPDGKTLVAGVGRIDQAREVGRTALGGTVSRFPSEIKLWDVATGKEKFTIGKNPPATGLCFSPDGKTFVSCGADETKEGGNFLPGVVKVWDSHTGKEKLRLDHERIATCAAFSPDGSTLASGSFGNAMTLWNLATGKSTAILQGHQKLLNCVAFSPDGKTLASGGYDEIVRLWDVATKKEKATLEAEEAVGPGRGVFAVAFSPDGKWLASGNDEGVKVWDVAAKKLVSVLQGNRCGALAFSPDGKVLAWASDNVVRLWDVASGNEKAQLKGHTDHVYSIAFNPDGKILASGSSDRTINFWDIDAIIKNAR